MKTVSVTEIQNNFDKYLNYVIEGNEIIITKNNKEITRLIPKEKPISFITNSLIGVLKNDYDEKSSKELRIKAHENL